MTDDQPEQDSEIRRRAAWLLAMLALVALLFVGLMVVFFNGSGGGGDNNVDDLAGPTDAVSTPGRSPSTGGSNTSGVDRTGTASSTSPGSTAASSTTAGSGRGSCPGTETCALDTDIGNAVAAINAYRTDNGKSPVTGSVSAEAKKCALSNGSDCSGGWAETQVPATDGKVDGKAAVTKIQQFGKLLSDMKSIEVGWAYDPGSKQYYFAIVRNT